ncbi:MAG: hypothetical protein HOP12_05015, partial [Candidatus Eisenbacteria bacterium]|nr:hypothetical protein [Candidatus Eisenbacteria bacterium]
MDETPNQSSAEDPNGSSSDAPEPRPHALPEGPGIARANPADRRLQAWSEPLWFGGAGMVAALALALFVTPRARTDSNSALPEFAAAHETAVS